MISATHDDVERLFPGIQDHAVVEILAIKPTVAQLEAASLLLSDQDDGLIAEKRKEGGQLSRLLAILSSAQLSSQEEPRR